MSKTEAVIIDKNLPAEFAPDQFLVMQIEPDDVGLTLQENLGETSLTVNDLPRIVVPGSGGTSWTIPTIEGEKMADKITGIIIFTKIVRTYWEGKFDGGGTPPDCFSLDGKHGMGIWAEKSKDGKCDNCPMSDFADDGTGCPCKENRLIFMVLHDEILPVVVKAPPTSLANAKEYLLKLSSRLKKTHSVYTTLKLETDKNASGIKYSKITFAKTGDVENPQLMASYAENIRPYLAPVARQYATGQDASV
jgi:hypothetical protein